MEYVQMCTLETSRLVLRRLREEDAADYFRMAGSHEVTKYMLFQPHRELSESVSSVRKTLRRYAEGRSYRWAITLRGEDRLMGVIDLLAFDEMESSCSFAYMLCQEHWGKGYGTEALRAVLDFGFRELKLQRIHADHFAENEASGAVMRKVGMVFRGDIPGKYEKNGQRHDAPQYEITRQQWLDGK